MVVVSRIAVQLMARAFQAPFAPVHFESNSEPMLVSREVLKGDPPPPQISNLSVIITDELEGLLHLTNERLDEREVGLMTSAMFSS